jgi:hypothetical protein
MVTKKSSVNAKLWFAAAELCATGCDLVAYGTGLFVGEIVKKTAHPRVSVEISI